jgi:drug/metabolite transporter (DMT)-like permease
VFVPLFSLLLGKRSGLLVWIGALLAAAGLYSLSMSGGLSMSRGDFLVLLGSVLWALQILYLGRFAGGADPFALAAGQFAVVAALSLIPAIALEGLGPAQALATLFPIVASGLLAVGLGFTLQILGQRSAQPARASLIMSLEAPFAALAGAIFLGEAFTPRMLLGAALMLSGMLLAQARSRRRG